MNKIKKQKLSSEAIEPTNLLRNVHIRTCSINCYAISCTCSSFFSRLNIRRKIEKNSKMYKTIVSDAILTLLMISFEFFLFTYVSNFITNMQNFNSVHYLLSNSFQMNDYKLYIFLHWNALFVNVHCIIWIVCIIFCLFTPSFI